VPLPFVNIHLAPQPTDLRGVATRFGGGDHPAVFFDPLVNLLATLDQQTQEIHGLAVIGRHPWRERGLMLMGRSRAMFADGLGTFGPLGVMPLGVMPLGVVPLGVMESSAAPIPVGSGVRVAYAVAGGRTARDHLVSPNWVLGFARTR
jgi:hypothetical protein